MTGESREKFLETMVTDCRSKILSSFLPLKQSSIVILNGLVTLTKTAGGGGRVATRGGAEEEETADTVGGATEAPSTWPNVAQTKYTSFII